MLHARARLGQEVLHDYFLHVAVSQVRCGDRFECCDAVGAIFADAHQNASGEGNLQLAGELEGVQTTLWHFVGRATMAFKIIAQGFNHHALRGRNTPQHRQLVFIQRTSVGVGQQTCFGEHQLGHVMQVVHGRVVAVGL